LKEVGFIKIVVGWFMLEIGGLGIFYEYLFYLQFMRVKFVGVFRPARPVSSDCAELPLEILWSCSQSQPAHPEGLDLRRKIC
jgi:hypothetical protein